MLCKVFCASCSGIDAVLITVEVDITPGISFYLVGLPDIAVKESQQRIGTALNRFGYRIPGRKIVINMAPANIRKEGSAFDSTIAVGILCASGQIPPEEIPQERLSKFLIMGELALDGSLRKFHGALPIAAHAAQMGFEACIFPTESASECAELDNITIFGADNLLDIIKILKSPEEAHSKITDTQTVTNATTTASGAGNTAGSAALAENDFALIKGQSVAKMGMEIAAAGNHNIILVGSPGCGKTLLAKSLPTILPPLSKKEAIETSKVYSVAGLLQNQHGFIKERPFRAPHHTATVSSLTGGGSNGMPGEISLAHNGVLYLDEFCEFSRTAIEVLRQPMEDGIIQISRVKNKYTYPANFMLVASMNPCPCGYYGSDQRQCNCSSSAITRYMGHLSGPILDRIDLQIMLKPVKSHEIVPQLEMVTEDGLQTGENMPECSATIAARVLEARKIQMHRFRNESFFTNSRIPASRLEQYCRIGSREVKFIRHIMEKFNLSARSYVRLLKISRTIADLDGKDFISLAHISKALQFRNHLTNNRYDH